MVLNRGVIIQNLVNELQKMGFNVNLYTFAFIKCEDEAANIIVKLKGVDEILDPRRAYFAFCNPSFFRRLIFRVVESTDFKRFEWNDVYGQICDYDMIKRAYRTNNNDIIIPQASEIGIIGKSINQDWKTFFKFEKLNNLRNLF